MSTATTVKETTAVTAPPVSASATVPQTKVIQSNFSFAAAILKGNTVTPASQPLPKKVSPTSGASVNTQVSAKSVNKTATQTPPAPGKKTKGTKGQTPTTTTAQVQPKKEIVLTPGSAWGNKLSLTNTPPAVKPTVASKSATTIATPPLQPSTTSTTAAAIPSTTATTTSESTRDASASPAPSVATTASPAPSSPALSSNPTAPSSADNSPEPAAQVAKDDHSTTAATEPSTPASTPASTTTPAATASTTRNRKKPQPAPTKQPKNSKPTTTSTPTPAPVKPVMIETSAPVTVTPAQPLSTRSTQKFGLVPVETKKKSSSSSTRRERSRERSTPVDESIPVLPEHYTPYPLSPYQLFLVDPVTNVITPSLSALNTLTGQLEELSDCAIDCVPFILLPSTTGLGVGELVNLYDSIAQQLSFYFSVDNLVRDTFLRGRMNERGYIPLQELLTFPRIQALTSSVYYLTIAARYCVELSSEVDADTKPKSLFKVKNGSIRLRQGWTKWIFPRQETEADESSEEELEENGATVESSPLAALDASVISTSSNTPASSSRASSPLSETPLVVA